MNHIRRKACLVLVLSLVLGLSACQTLPTHPREDRSGTTEFEALSMTMQEQFDSASARYLELNTRLASLQKEIYEGKWGSVESEVFPQLGGTRARLLPGATLDNSYFFEVQRRFYTDTDLPALVAKVRGQWEARGWKVMEERVFSDARLTVLTADGFWFEANEQHPVGTESSGLLLLVGRSPVYWGSSEELLTAVRERRNAENIESGDWYLKHSDADDRVMLLPGEFRPFPAWDAPLDLLGRDPAGLHAAEAVARPLVEQYLQAAQLYAETNERMAATQRAIFDGAWTRNDIQTAEYLPHDGGFRTKKDLEASTADNSYYFRFIRYFVVPHDIQAPLDRARDAWEAAGWQVEEQPTPGQRSLTATADGYWFELMETRQEHGSGESTLRLTVSSPTHWGDTAALIVAVQDRQKLEAARSASWDATHRSTDGEVMLLPGEYRPFPAWDALREGASDK